MGGAGAGRRDAGRSVPVMETRGAWVGSPISHSPILPSPGGVVGAVGVAFPHLPSPILPSPGGERPGAGRKGDPEEPDL